MQQECRTAISRNDDSCSSNGDDDNEKRISNSDDNAQDIPNFYFTHPMKDNDYLQRKYTGEMSDDINHYLQHIGAKLIIDAFEAT
jgi:hypothetical protein